MSSSSAAGGLVDPGIPEALRRFGLSGRVAVVTGASSGLGREVAHSLASAGARLAAPARRRDRLLQLAEEIGGLPVSCDLLDPAQVSEIVPLARTANPSEQAFTRL